jgi:excisionase family DNA binding protein
MRHRDIAVGKPGAQREADFHSAARHVWPIWVSGSRRTIESPVLTVRELARYLSIDKAQVYRLAKAGMLPAFKLGSDWRFNIESIRAWVSRNDAIGRW